MLPFQRFELPNMPLEAVVANILLVASHILATIRSICKIEYLKLLTVHN